MAFGQSGEEGKQLIDDAATEVVSTIPFPISDGTPAPPIVTPEPPEFRTVNSLTRRTYVKRAVRRVIGHSHPWSLPASGPSGGDLDALQQLGQRSSYLLERGSLTKFPR